MARISTFMATLENYQKKYPNPVKTITMEGIAFQKNDSFGPQLEAIVQKYKDLVDAGVNAKAISGNKTLAKELEDCVKNRLGITISLKTNSYLAATIPNVFVPHNAVIKDDIRWIFEDLEHISGQKEIRKLKDRAVLGTVNTETAKVTGWFSQQTVPVYSNFYQLFKDFGMSVKEVVAIILHELGHNFTSIELAVNVNTANRILADVARYTKDTDRGGDIEVVYRDIKKIYPEATRDIAEGLMSGNAIVMSVATYRLIIGTTQTLMFDKTYDRTTFEMSADNFASRFGYAVELITSLEKLDKQYPEHTAREELFSAVIFFTLLSFAFSLSIMSLAFTTTTGVIAGSALIYLLIKFIGILIGTQRTSIKDMTYDTIRDRYIRIRSQIVQLIKDPDVDVETKRSLLDQIKTMDEIISHKKVFVSFLEKFFSSVIPSDKRAATSIAAQQEIEKMIANNIFVSANRLALKG